MLTRFLARKWRNRDDIPDLLQDIYVRVYEAARQQHPQAVKPFLFAVARNLMIDRARHLGVAPEENVTDFDALNVIDYAPSPERQTLARDELRHVQDAINAMPSRCRQILVWRRLENVPQREVAARLGVTEEVVEYQLAKALRLLAKAVRSPRESLIARAKRFLFVGGPQ